MADGNGVSVEVNSLFVHVVQNVELLLSTDVHRIDRDDCTYMVMLCIVWNCYLFTLYFELNHCLDVWSLGGFLWIDKYVSNSCAN